MRGRQFLNVAHPSSQESQEEWWRTAAGRAYHALFLEARAALIRWAIPGIPQFQIHAFIRNRYLYAADLDLRRIGDMLKHLYDLRAQADYEIDVLGPFHSYFASEQAVIDAEDVIDLLDSIDRDPARRSAVVAAILAVP